MARASVDQACNRMMTLLDESVRQASALKALLEEERAILEREDMQTIESVVAAKSEIAEALRLLENQRTDLCEAWGFDASDDPMQEVIDWCDAAGLVRKRWQQLLNVAAEASAINLTNGAIIRLRQQQFEAQLSLLRGRTPRLDTYGQQGNESGDFGRQSLAQA